MWAMWGATALAVGVTYTWVDTDELYNVSRQGLAGGLGRTTVLFNYPIVFVAVATTLVATAALPRRAWLAAAPAIACTALVPFVVDQDDLDVRPANAIPALGVLVALVLTLLAARRAGLGFAPRRPGDGVRAALAVAVLLVSLPWLTAALGFHFPGDFFMGEEVFREEDGTLLAAVHLGHHHGLDGSLLVLTALLLSRVAVEARLLRTRADRVPRAHARVRERQPRAGLLVRADREARLDGRGDPARARSRPRARVGRDRPARGRRDARAPPRGARSRGARRHTPAE